MVPSLSKSDDQNDHRGEADEDHLLSRVAIAAPWSESPTPRRTHLSAEELELGFQGERRKVRLRAAAILFTIVVVGTACAIIAYKWAWSAAVLEEEHESYDRAKQPLSEDGYQPIKSHLLYIGIVSPISHFQQRTLARQTWVNEARRHAGGIVKVEFLIGQAPLQRDQQNPFEDGGVAERESRQKVATIGEKELEQRLQIEGSSFNDISRIPVIDETLVFDTDAVLWVFENALSWKARFVMKVRDDQFVALDRTLGALRQRFPMAPPAYFGKVWTQNDMDEADGRVSWFYHGDCYGVSGDLAHKIAVTHFTHTVGFPSYGTSRDDVNVAKWVEYESEIRKQHQIPPVQHMWMPSLCGSIVKDTLPSSSPCDLANPCDEPPS